MRFGVLGVFLRALSIGAITIVAGSTSRAESDDATVFRYVGFTQGEHFSFEWASEGSVNGRVIYGGHVSSPIESCSAESDYHCFASMYHAFAVPKRFDSSTRRWTVRGIQFELVAQNVELSILGRRFTDLYLIETAPDGTVMGRQSGKPGHSLYSRKFGLIGFDVPRDASSTYWIVDQCGFGAAADCASASSDE